VDTRKKISCFPIHFTVFREHPEGRLLANRCCRTVLAVRNRHFDGIINPGRGFDLLDDQLGLNNASRNLLNNVKLNLRDAPLDDADPFSG
jgi:hypothetical protein